MTEEQIKTITKCFIQNSNRALSDNDKEIIKHEVDRARSFGELIKVLVEARIIELNNLK